MNATVTAVRAMRVERSAFHSQPFAIPARSANPPMLIALWSSDDRGRLVQNWVSVAIARGENAAGAYRPAR